MELNLSSSASDEEMKWAEELGEERDGVGAERAKPSECPPFAS